MVLSSGLMFSSPCLGGVGLFGGIAITAAIHRRYPIPGSGGLRTPGSLDLRHELDRVFGVDQIRVCRRLTLDQWCTKVAEHVHYRIALTSPVHCVNGVVRVGLKSVCAGQLDLTRFQGIDGPGGPAMSYTLAVSR